MGASSLEILTASWVLPVSAAPLRGGRVAVGGGRIVWVGRAGEPGEPEAPVRDLGTGVLMPGLVNAHCHLELSHLAGKLPLAQGFASWVLALVACRGRASERERDTATADAIRFLEQRGTVAVGDVSNAAGHATRLAGSRLDGVVFLELLAWDPAHAEGALAWAEARRASVAASLRPGLSVKLAAHAPHSCSPELLRRLAEQGGPAAIHLAESPEETRFLANGRGEWAEFLANRGLGLVAFRAPGLSPVRYLERLHALNPGLLAAHAVHLDEGDPELLARRGVAVVLCPRSNRNLRVGTADLPALLAAGVRLGLGTDSLASVETLDVLDDAVLLRRQFPSVPAATIVGIATAGGASVLGLDQLGSIAPGRRAALAFAAADRPPEEPCEWLLSGAARLAPVELS
jgi:cytosine/adenosine deaminase-related metal-dependent hydrolase